MHRGLIVTFFDDQSMDVGTDSRLSKRGSGSHRARGDKDTSILQLADPEGKSRTWTGFSAMYVKIVGSDG